jgi:multiple sugar transport system ATP-binding protein
VAKIVLDGLTKSFKGPAAVYDLNLEIEDGEFMIIVGPSGCGKTTTLRMLAGFETPTSGRILIGDQVVNDVAPKDRDVAMVFQNYALFPHMTVEKNLAFGMKVRRESKATIKRQVAEVLGLLGIDHLADRKPAELSGGERQRVALGRALLRRPKAFLLDEPLSNLDAALRTQMRSELKRIHAHFPVTTVYVTHDQVEAMTMGDRIALMNLGRLQQVATPEILYSEPANVFVAGFVGSPKMNLIPAEVKPGASSPIVRFLSCEIPVNGAVGSVVGALAHGQVVVGFRPEEVQPCRPDEHGAGVTMGVVELVEPLGAETHVSVRIGEEILICKFPARSGLQVGGRVNLSLDLSRMKVFDGESGERLG